MYITNYNLRLNRVFPRSKEKSGMFIQFLKEGHEKRANHGNQKQRKFDK